MLFCYGPLYLQVIFANERTFLKVSRDHPFLTKLLTDSPVDVLAAVVALWDSDRRYRDDAAQLYRADRQGRTHLCWDVHLYRLALPRLCRRDVHMASVQTATT